ncbi:AAA family ATPase [Dongia sp.]|uniref:bifunctional aminoglycoside phosphotransferase/ATP-binding protein n=1 Tax=Dongia sp. TaxID=1977262 RepID=UPI003751F4B6
MSEEAQRETVAFLSDPRAHGGAEVETITTHASRIFMAGERVLKLKRAVQYSYLDFSTPELRRGSCEEELRLNRRTAPNLYLDVQPVTREANGLALGGKGEPVDWVVVMRRFPQEALFSHLAEADRLTPDLMRRLADNIVAFHRDAEITPDFGGVKGVEQVIRINDENLRRDGPPVIPVGEAEALTAAARKAAGDLADLLEQRRIAGKVRQCHGDLHLRNISLIDGEPTLFDCIEFNPSLAAIDVLYDLAFLLMDLRYRGHGTEAAIVFNRYMDVSDESDGIAAMPLFLSLRAWVRAHVTATAAKSGAGDAAEARRYFDLARDLLKPRPPRLVAVGGLSGTGKSTIAAILAGRLGLTPARVLRSDVIRKRLFGAAPEQRLPAEAYARDATERVYAQLEAEAQAAIAAGSSVIIDAVSAKAEERTAFAALGERLSVPFDGIWLEAPPEILCARVGARKNDASDADLAVLERQLGYDLGAIDWHRIDASPAPEAIADAALKAISR